MFRICNSRSKQFYVLNLGINGEVLSTSELYVKKQSCWKNILSILRGVFTDGKWSYVAVQDDTRPYLPVYKFFSDGSKVISGLRADPKYIPGKNPKRKSVKTRIAKRKMKA